MGRHRHRAILWSVDLEPTFILTGATTAILNATPWVLNVKEQQ